MEVDENSRIGPRVEQYAQKRQQCKYVLKVFQQCKNIT